MRWFAEEAAWRRHRVLNAFTEESPQDVAEYSEALDTVLALGFASLLLAAVLAVLAAGAWRDRIAAVRPVAWGLLPVQVVLVVVGHYRAGQYTSGYEEAWFIPQPQTVDQYWGAACGVLASVVALVFLTVRRAEAAAGGDRPRRVRVAALLAGAAAPLVLLMPGLWPYSTPDGRTEVGLRNLSSLALVVTLGAFLAVLAVVVAVLAVLVRPGRRRIRAVAAGLAVTAASLVVLVAGFQAANRYVSGLPDFYRWTFLFAPVLGVAVVALLGAAAVLLSGAPVVRFVQPQTVAEEPARAT
ncbi:hypothetical protein SAMN05443668_12488 [Cryptosporangium aurantiacum]|uniref:Uncharacterized protein n=1 Tax=Cryptosporangium aurantiacum TaxID=134849 RepID=A0A1M7RMW0_9ACTN|nr:hypothetical protein SAMN05443668_12488 [Cryptosporangium aurantiacum]